MLCSTTIRISLEVNALIHAYRRENRHIGDYYCKVRVANPLELEHAQKGLCSETIGITWGKRSNHVGRAHELSTHSLFRSKESLSCTFISDFLKSHATSNTKYREDAVVFDVNFV